MIDLTQSRVASPLVHQAACDPGVRWSSVAVAVDAPPDDEPSPAPDGKWPTAAVRSGVCGAVSPRVVALAEGGYRVYYTQILPRDGWPAGASDYDQASSRILSAVSSDGERWVPEPGVRLTPREGGAGEFRVASSEVVPTADGRLRMYFECCPGPQTTENSIRSAVSRDGLIWAVEPSERFRAAGSNVSSPRIQFLDGGECRLYCQQRGLGIVSAKSQDGLTFHREAGVRVAPDGPLDRLTAFAPEILRLPEGGYRMYYAGYGNPLRADILTARSSDGLAWEKSPDPVLSPGSAPWDAAKCSEMCVLWSTAPAPESLRDFRMLYEACDGTVPDRRGVWRIAAATPSSNPE